MSANNSYHEMNEEVAKWAKLQAQRMRRYVGGLTLKTKIAAYKIAWAKAKYPEYKQLQKSIGSGTRKEFGQISRINFRFQRQGLFLEHGSGRNRLLTSNNYAKPWIKPILDPAIDNLADLLIEKYADRIQGEIKINIPNVISRTIKITDGK